MSSAVDPLVKFGADPDPALFVSDLQVANKKIFLSSKCFAYYQCGGSGMFIPDPKTATKERGEKNLMSYLSTKPQISQN